MGKLLLLLALVGAALWWLARRRGGPRSGPSSPPAAPPPQAMQACAHCGVHLPAAEALRDAQGRPYCTEAHRLSGPR